MHASVIDRVHAGYRLLWWVRVVLLLKSLKNFQTAGNLLIFYVCWTERTELLCSAVGWPQKTVCLCFTVFSSLVTKRFSQKCWMDADSMLSPYERLTLWTHFIFFFFKQVSAVVNSSCFISKGRYYLTDLLLYKKTFSPIATLYFFVIFIQIIDLDHFVWWRRRKLTFHRKDTLLGVKRCCFPHQICRQNS